MSSSTFATELRWAWRNLRRRRGRAACTAAQLGIAIGAGTVLFSSADSLVFRRVIYPDSDRLVEFQRKHLKTGNILGGFVSPATLAEWQQHTDLFTGVHGYIERTVFLAGGNSPELISTAEITPGLIELLRVTPRWGATLTDADAQQLNPRVGLISESLARRRFGNPVLAVGQLLPTTAEPILVAGVMPQQFRFPSGVEEIWRAVDPRPTATRRAMNLSAIARLNPGVSQARAAQVVEQRSAEVFRASGASQDYAAIVSPLRASAVAERQQLLMVLLVAASACLLVIACANAASLELADAVRRARLYAMHLVVGASRPALARVALIEGALVLSAASVVAWLVASTGTAAVASQLPPALANGTVNPIDLDARGLVFLGSGGVVAWIVSTLPVLHYIRRAELLDVLKVEGHGMAGSRDGQRLRRGLIVIELGVAVLLLIGGTLYVRSYLTLIRVDKGFDSRNVISLSLTIPPQFYSSEMARRALATTIVEELRSRPGVIAVTHGSAPPAMGAVFASRGIETDAAPAAEQSLLIGLLDVSPEYFSVLRVPLRSGRLLTDGDPPTTVVVSESFARRFWPGSDAAGRRFRFDQRWFTVVGVVGHVRTSRDDVAGPSATTFQLYQLRQPPRPEPPNAAVNPGLAYSFIDLIVRTDTPSRTMDLVATLRGIEPRFPLRVRLVDDIYSERHADVLLATRVTGAFAAVAVAVALAGLYAVMSFLVATRVREIGVRMALGADAAAVLRLVMASSLPLVIAGAGLGLLGAFGASRWMQSQLFGVSAVDAWSYAAVSAAVIGLALVASWFPARRAASLNPVDALRQ